jgi:ubiquinone/menaquinone biosynthesis C-methylase UbiE
MPDSSSNQELFQYYNERAPEYEAFYRGEFPTPHSNPDIYKNDTAAIAALLPHYVNGACIDIACGTGFWLSVYHRCCSHITLIDQSESVLDECAKKIQDLGIENKTSIIRDDLFNHPFPDQFDSAVTGFLISHFTDRGMSRFFNYLKSLLKKSGRFVIIDSLWSEEVAAFRRSREGMVKRALYDGREFEIYKRFFIKKDMDNIADEHSMKLEIVYWGRVFFLAAGRFPDAPA